jgi:hypothetical protein
LFVGLQLDNKENESDNSEDDDIQTLLDAFVIPKKPTVLIDSPASVKRRMPLGITLMDHNTKHGRCLVAAILLLQDYSTISLP